MTHLATSAGVSDHNFPKPAGDGSTGQLGDGNSGDGYRAALPVTVHGDHEFVAVCTGLSHSCGLDASGRAWCWGLNTAGQLGDGTQITNPKPVEVESSGRAFRSITCGGYHTCALDAAGKAWCWGTQGAQICAARHIALLAHAMCPGGINMRPGSLNL